MAKAELEAWASEHGASLETVFVPWSQSRSYVAGTPAFRRNLNWRCTLRRWHGLGDAREPRPVISFDYSAGIAHAPIYKRAHRPGEPRFNTLHWEKAIIHETEIGRASLAYGSSGVPIRPSFIDVLASIALDASAIDSATFEDWAGELGYDPDSRKGEAIYRECLAHALAIRAAFGEAALAALREAASDY